MSRRPIVHLQSAVRTLCSPPYTRASFTTTCHLSDLQSSSSSSPQPSTKPNPRTATDLTTRLSTCIKFGLNTSQTVEASKILKDIATSWRDLIAGTEGFLTSPQRRGLYRQEVIWGEMDVMSHVNNVAYIRYAESARINWALRYAQFHDLENSNKWRELWTPKGDGLILRRIEVDFKFPMTYPDKVTVYHKLASIPKPDATSFDLEVIILSEKHRRVAARCREDIVLYDYRVGRKIPLDSRPFMLDKFRETWRLQEEAKKLNKMKLDMLATRVRVLELESWDREDAVEDLGSASP